MSATLKGRAHALDDELRTVADVKAEQSGGATIANVRALTADLTDKVGEALGDRPFHSLDFKMIVDNGGKP